MPIQNRVVGRKYKNPVGSSIAAGKAFFEDLFVLELANNHLGSLDRGLRIIGEHSRMVRFNNVRAAIKLQFRDVESFVHRDYRERKDIRYVAKTMATALPKEQLRALVDGVIEGSCIPMATPFDERSVDLCQEFDIPIIKIASSDINDWMLIEKIATLRKPVIASTGGSSLKDIDDVVTFFANRSIPLAINHCVSIYPSEDSELELNQIDFLLDRYPDIVVGFSTHEYHDWKDSMLIAYAKGARTFERHIDVELDGVKVSPYCSLPQQVDEWFKAFHRASRMCGAPGTQKRLPPEKEIKYLDSLVRGVYAKRSLKAGEALTEEGIYLAIPLLKGQLSCRELMHGETMASDCREGEAVLLEMIDGPHLKSESLREMVSNRGIDRVSSTETATSSLAAMARALENESPVKTTASLDGDSAVNRVH